MLTLKAIKSLKSYETADHHFKRSLFSVWLRPETFYSRFEPTNFFYQATYIDGSGSTNFNCKTPEEAWAIFKEYKKGLSNETKNR